MWPLRPSDKEVITFPRANRDLPPRGHVRGKFGVYNRKLTRHPVALSEGVLTLMLGVWGANVYHMPILPKL